MTSLILCHNNNKSLKYCVDVCDFWSLRSQWKREEGCLKSSFLQNILKSRCMQLASSNSSTSPEGGNLGKCSIALHNQMYDSKALPIISPRIKGKGKLWTPDFSWYWIHKRRRHSSFRSSMENNFFIFLTWRNINPVLCCYESDHSVISPLPSFLVFQKRHFWQMSPLTLLYRKNIQKV